MATGTCVITAADGGKATATFTVGIVVTTPTATDYQNLSNAFTSLAQAFGAFGAALQYESAAIEAALATGNSSTILTTTQEIATVNSSFLAAAAAIPVPPKTGTTTAVTVPTLLTGV